MRKVVDMEMITSRRSIDAILFCYFILFFFFLICENCSVLRSDYARVLSRITTVGKVQIKVKIALRHYEITMLLILSS